MKYIVIIQKYYKYCTKSEVKIKADKIKSDKIKADKIKSDKIKADKIKSDKIKADKIKSDVIKADKIKADKIKADKIKADKIKADKIKAKFKKETKCNCIDDEKNTIGVIFGMEKQKPWCYTNKQSAEYIVSIPKILQILH